MASVIPTVFVALALVASMLTILGGIIQYYSTIYMEPTILPAYGTVYVFSIDDKRYVITIMNKFGYTFKALFTVYVSEVTPPPPAGLPSPYVSFWVDLYPGENEIGLEDYVKARLVLPENTTVTIDLSKSYFIIGEVKYPIKVGAGLLKPVEVKKLRRTYVIEDLGVKPFTPYERYGSAVFDATDVKITNKVSAKMGYLRSIYGYVTTGKVVLDERGDRCRCENRTYEGRITEKEEVLDEECYKECYEECYLDCIIFGDPILCDSICSSRCKDACTEVIETCAWTTCEHEDCDTYYYINSKTRTFGCAYDGGFGPDYTSKATVTQKLTFSTIALHAVNYFSLPLSRDVTTKNTSGTDYVTGTWAYILEDQSQCYYDYVERRYYADLTIQQFKACDEDCGVTRYYRECKETVEEKVVEDLWACGDRKCAGLDRYLYMRISWVYINVTSPLTTEGKLKLIFNLTYAFEYYIAKEDPEAVGDYIYLWLRNNITLTFPEVNGYVGLAYTDTLSNVKLVLKPEIIYSKAVIKTASGQKFTVYPRYEVKDKEFDVETAPVGYVPLTAKTYRYETKENPAISIVIKSPKHWLGWEGFLIRKQEEDKIILNIYLELEITLELVVNAFGV